MQELFSQHHEKMFCHTEAAFFIPDEPHDVSDTLTYVIDGSNGSKVLVSYKDAGEGTWEVSLYVNHADRTRWGNKAFWRQFYSIPFNTLGCKVLVAETENPIVISMLEREGWMSYADGWWGIKRHMVRHFMNKEVTQ